MRGELSSVVLGERERDWVERTCCSNVAVALRAGGKASRAGFYKALCPFAVVPKVTGGLLMGRTDVFPEVGAAKHPVSQPGEFQPKILEPPWQRSCVWYHLSLNGQ